MAWAFDMSAKHLSSIIGADEATATRFLEMAGGDINAAAALYFSFSEPTAATQSPVGEICYST